MHAMDIPYVSIGLNSPHVTPWTPSRAPFFPGDPRYSWHYQRRQRGAPPKVAANMGFKYGRLCIYMYICISICIYVYMYILVYVYKYMYISVCIYIYICMIDVTPQHPSLSSFCSLYFPTLDLLIQNQKHLPHTRVKKGYLGKQWSRVMR